MQQTIRLRLIDEYSVNEEFPVDSPMSLMVGINSAYVKLHCKSNCLYPAVEMYLDFNDKWVSPNFPSIFEYILSTPLLSQVEAGSLYQRIRRMYRVLNSNENEEAQLTTLYLWLSED